MAVKEPAALTLRLMNLFAGLERAHGVYELPSGKGDGTTKVEGRGKTIKEPVTPAMWTAHVAGVQGLGIVPIRDNGTCLFGAIDIDRYEPDLLSKIERQCAELNLPLLPTRTKSGGVHLYLFGSEPLAASLLKIRLEEWSIALGFAGVEIFPKQSQISPEDVGNWINMPYFGIDTGSTERYGIFKGQLLTLSQYVERAEALRITSSQLHLLQISGDDGSFLNGPPCLQSLARIGFPMGARNNGLFAVAVYLKKRYPDDWKNQLGSYNQRYMRPPLPEGEVKMIIKGASRKKYSYACDEFPIKKYCNRALCITREFGVGGELEDWGIHIDPDVQRIDTDPPCWWLKINGTRIRFYAEDLTNQHKFQVICCNSLSFWPGLLPAGRWRTEMNKIMASAVPVEAPADASAGGELADYLERFCTVFPQAETREEILTGKPFTEEGLTLFRGADFRKFLESQHFRSVQPREMFPRLHEMLGVQPKQISINDKMYRVWAAKAYDKHLVKAPTRGGKNGKGEGM